MSRILLRYLNILDILIILTLIWFFIKVNFSLNIFLSIFLAFDSIEYNWNNINTFKFSKDLTKFSDLSLSLFFSSIEFSSLFINVSFLAFISISFFKEFFLSFFKFK